MVPIPESSYFPSLDKCLNGEQLLLSWKTAFSAVNHGDSAAKSDSRVFQKFLADSDVLDLLSNPCNAFPGPSQQTKSAFETRTSAINVTPSPSARYDIKQVKDDALWLSKEATIDEVSALRVVVEECQSRTAVMLLGSFSNEELASIQGASGNSKLFSSMPASLFEQGKDPEAAQMAFETQGSRKLRILRTYLSERRHLLNCAQAIYEEVIYFAGPPPDDAGKGKGKQVAAPAKPSLYSVFRAKLADPTEFLLQCFQAVERSVRNMESGCGWSVEDVGWEELELDWMTTQIMELTNTMKIIFQVLDSSLSVPSSTVVLGWFRLSQACGFFDQFSMDDLSLQTLILPMRCIATVINLAMLSVGSCLDYLGDPAAEATPATSSDEEDTRPYILNTGALTEIHTIMMAAGVDASPTSGPAILAWVSLLQMMRTRSANKELARHEGIDAFEDSPRGFRRTLSTDGEDQLKPDAYQVVINEVMDSTEEDPVEYLGLMAVNHCRLFDTLSEIALRLGGTSHAFFSNIFGARVRISILELLRCSSAVGYIPEVLETNIAALTGGQTYWDRTEAEPLQIENDPLASFWRDEELVAMFLQAARLRYPYESMPFLRILRAIAACSNCYDGDGRSPAIQFLKKISTFTYQLPAGFISYETAQEEDNSNNIRLTESVPLFQRRSRGRGLQGRSMELLRIDEDLVIAQGSSGRIISDSGPKVVFWFHEYSGLKYLGKLVETFLTAGDEIDAIKEGIADRESVAEIIDIFAIIVLNIYGSSDTTTREAEFVQQFLEAASSGLSRKRDIIAVIFDIFEEELQKQSASAGYEPPLEVLVSCLHFAHAVLQLCPNRVWPILARSGLLGISSGGSSRLSGILENVEIVAGRYDLLISCCHLFTALVEDFVSNATIRRLRNDSSAGQIPQSRFAPQDVDSAGKGTGVSDQILSKVLLSLTRHLLDALENSCIWKFAEQDDRRRVTTSIIKTLDNILHYSYGLNTYSGSDGTGEPHGTASEAASSSRAGVDAQVLESLMPAASYIVDNYLSTASGILRFQPLLRALYEGLHTPKITFSPNQLHLWTAQVQAVLSFSKVVLRVGILLERPTSQFEIQLFRCTPIVARLYAIHDSYKEPVIALFEALVVSSGSSASEPPSLLGHLGSRTAKNFIHILSDFDKPLARQQTDICIWHFFSMVISNRQQWFANYLLTGKTPKDALETETGRKAISALDNPPLKTAFDTIMRIREIARPKAIATLQFVAFAQNFWPWSVYEAEKQPELITAISEFIGTLPPIQPCTNAEDELEACYKTRIAAYIAQLLAMYLFHSRHIRSQPIVQDLLPNLVYYSRFAVAATGYNMGKQGMLKRNFVTNHLGDPRVFERSTLETQQYGKDYFYHVGLADKMLSWKTSWDGQGGGGFRQDLIRANTNFCLVDAEIALFNDWKFLAVELSNHMANNLVLQSLLSKVSIDCLNTNAKNQLPEEIFAKLSQSRADFALVLIQRLFEVRSKAPELQKLFEIVWRAIHSLRGAFERTLEGSDVVYYRTLLKILFLAPSVHMQSQNDPANPGEAARALTSPIIPITLDVLRLVIANGIRETVGAIHEKPQEALPADIALITGILQSCLQVPGIELCHAQIVSMMVAGDAARVATTLFSWSDNLAINGDPIYGELSILFLLELSSMPLMAEQLAIDGVLGQVAAANITSYLRRGNVSPFADGAGLQRCYNIWVRGILPLLLNLLDSVQASIASEVALFLNQFPSLLHQSAQLIEAPDALRGSQAQPKFLTLSICSELHSLALLTVILNGFRANPVAASIAEIPEVKWDSAGVLENVEFWLGSRSVLRERILPMGVRDMELAKKKVEGRNGDGPSAKAVTMLEVKVVAELAGIRDVLSGDN